MSFEQWNHPLAGPDIGQRMREANKNAEIRVHRPCLGCGHDYLENFKSDELCKVPDDVVRDLLGADYVGEIFLCPPCVEEYGLYKRICG